MISSSMTKIFLSVIVSSGVTQRLVLTQLYYVKRKTFSPLALVFPRYHLYDYY